MKFIAIFYFCTIIASSFILVNSHSVNIQIARDIKEEELQAEYCKFPKYSPFRRECALFKCSKDRTKVVAIPCPYSPCSNKLSYTEEEFAEPYPYCCAPPDCET